MRVLGYFALMMNRSLDYHRAHPGERERLEALPGVLAVWPVMAGRSHDYMAALLIEAAACGATREVIDEKLRKWQLSDVDVARLCALQHDIWSRQMVGGGFEAALAGVNGTLRADYTFGWTRVQAAGNLLRSLGYKPQPRPVPMAEFLRGLKLPGI